MVGSTEFPLLKPGVGVIGAQINDHHIGQKFLGLLELWTFGVGCWGIRNEGRILGSEVLHLKFLAQHFLKLGWVAVCFRTGNSDS